MNSDVTFAFSLLLIISGIALFGQPQYAGALAVTVGIYGIRAALRGDRL